MKVKVVIKVSSNGGKDPKALALYALDVVRNEVARGLNEGEIQAVVNDVSVERLGRFSVTTE